MDSYVYLHIKANTGEPFYVGKGRKNRYKSMQSRSSHWKNIVSKYGFDTIFLEEDLDDATALEKEMYWINRIGRKDLGTGPLINHTDGGEGMSGFKHSKEFSELMSKVHRGNKYAVGKTLSDEHKENLSKALKGIKKAPFSDEHKANLSGKTPWNKGKKVGPLSDEHRAKLCLAWERRKNNKQ